MSEFTDEDMKTAAKNLFMYGGTPNVIDCIISMAETQIQILKALKALLNKEPK